MVGVEIDMVVKDSLIALELYEKIFEIERVEVTNFSRGENEAIFTIRIHTDGGVLFVDLAGHQLISICLVANNLINRNIVNV